MDEGAHDWQGDIYSGTLTCSQCKRVASIEAPVCDHEYDAGEITRYPTCGMDGTKTYMCSKCSWGKSEIVPATGAHNVVDNMCTICGKKPEVYCDTTLPTTISYYSGSRIQSSCIVTDVTFKISGDDLEFYVTGKKTYDSRGSGQSDSCKIGWKLYDEENYVIDSGTIYTLSLAEGEGFRKAKDYAYGTFEKGKTYRLVLLNVN